MPDIQYNITLSDGTRTTFNEQQYNDNKDKLFGKYADAQVTSTQAFSPDDDDILDTDSFRIDLGDGKYSVFSASQFQKYRDKILTKYPNGVSKIWDMSSRYWDQRSREAKVADDASQPIGQFNDEADTTRLKPGTTRMKATNANTQTANPGKAKAAAPQAPEENKDYKAPNVANPQQLPDYLAYPDTAQPYGAQRVDLMPMRKAPQEPANYVEKPEVVKPKEETRLTPPVGAPTTGPNAVREHRPQDDEVAKPEEFDLTDPTLYEWTMPDGTKRYATKSEMFLERNRQIVDDFNEAMRDMQFDPNPEKAREQKRQYYKEQLEKRGILYSEKDIDALVDASNAVSNPPEEEKKSWWLLQGFWKSAKQAAARMGGEILGLVSEEGRLLGQNIAGAYTKDSALAQSALEEFDRRVAAGEDPLRDYGKEIAQLTKNYQQLSKEAQREVDKKVDVYTKIATYAKEGRTAEEVRAALEEEANTKVETEKLNDIAQSIIAANSDEVNTLGGVLGGLTPMFGTTALGIGLTAATKNPKYAQAAGRAMFGVFSASSAGGAMLQAKEAGASSEQEQLAGLASAAIMYGIGRIPFNRINLRIAGQASTQAAKGLEEAIANPSTKKAMELELKNLFDKASNELGFKLNSKYYIKEYLEHVASHTASFGAMGGLEAVVPLIYQSPDEYPVLSNVLQGALEGARDGLFLGAIMGVPATYGQYRNNVNRWKNQGFMAAAEVELKGKVDIEGPSGGMTTIEMDEAKPRIVEVTNWIVTPDGMPRFEVIIDGKRAWVDANQVKSVVGKDLNGDKKYKEYKEGEQEPNDVVDADYNVDEDAYEVVMATAEQQGRNASTPEAASEIKQQQLYIEEKSRREGEENGGKVSEETQFGIDRAAAQRKGRKDSIRSMVEEKIGQQLADDSRVIRLEDGTNAFIVGETDTDLAYIDETGKKGTIEKSKVQESRTIDEYLDGMLDGEDGLAEQTRMQSEQSANHQAVVARATEMGAIDIGTPENPMVAPIVSMDNTGVVLQTSEGNVPKTWKEVAAYLNMPYAAKTDAEIVNDRLADEDRAAKYNRDIKPGTDIQVMLDMGEGETPVPFKFQEAVINEDGALVIKATPAEGGEAVDILPEMIPDLDRMMQPAAEEPVAEQPVSSSETPEAVAETPAPVEDNILRDIDGDPIPINESGKRAGQVNEAAFWTSKPEAWAAWNDEKRQDGGANSKLYIANAIKKLEGDISKAEKEYAKTMDFDKRNDIEESMGGLQERLARLNALLESYKAAEAAEKEAAKQQSLRERERGLGEYLNFRDFLLRKIGNGEVKFKWKTDANKSTKGLGAHLGLGDSEAERRKRFWMLSEKDGAYPEVAAENLASEYASLMGWEDYRDHIEYPLDELLEVLGEADTPTGFIDAASALRKTENVPEIKLDRQGNPIYPDGTLVVEKVNTLEEITDEDFMNPSRTVELPKIPANVDAAIGAEGKPIVIKRNVFEKNAKEHSFSPVESRSILLSALYNPNLVGQTQPQRRPNYWVAIKTGETSPITVLEVNRNKDNVEVVGWYTLDERNLERIKRQAEREDGELLILTPVQGAAASLSTLPLSESSNSKDTTISEITNDNLSATQQAIAAERTVVDTNPTEGQKEAGNYRKGHIRLDGYEITIENPKGSVRRGVDAQGKAWEQPMNNDYGYFRRTEGTDGDHIDVFLSDNPEQGNIFVVDQVNPQTGEFDEHKVMYGFNSIDEAKEAYLSNYEEGWKGLGKISEVSKEEFNNWVESSNRKTKPFAEYRSVDFLDVDDMPYFSAEDPVKALDTRLAEIDSQIVEHPDERARLIEERAAAIQEFAEAIKTDDNSTVITSTRATLEEDMRRTGSSEGSIRKALMTIDLAIQRHARPRAFREKGNRIFLLTEMLIDAKDVETAFIHEEEHNVTFANGDQYIVASMADRDNLLGAIDKWVGYQPEYHSLSDYGVANEFISHAIERTYGQSDEEITKTLNEAGIDNEEIINFVKNRVHERNTRVQNSKLLSEDERRSGRRDAHVDGSARENLGQDGRDNQARPVSGLDGEGLRPDESGTPGTGSRGESSQDISLAISLGGGRTGRSRTATEARGEVDFSIENGLPAQRELERVNAAFNEELQQQKNGKQEAGHIYDLGFPGAILRSTGIPNRRITLASSILNEKSNAKRHPYDLLDIKDLPNEIQRPWAIFEYGDKDKAQNLIVGISSNGKQFLVGLALRPTLKNGETLEINSIRNVFPKDNAEWINWIKEGKLLRLDEKEKIQAAVDALRMNPVDYLNDADLDFITNVVNNFENPKFSYADDDISASKTPEVVTDITADAGEGTALFSLDKGGHTLVGIHNISGDKLAKALRLGGLANPSSAVIDIAKQDHFGYGDISLVMPSSLVDKKTGRNIGTYDRDAWTPTYPRIHYFENKQSRERLKELCKDLPKDLYYNISHQLTMYLDGDVYNSGLEYIFLREKGMPVEMQKVPRDYPNASLEEFLGIYLKVPGLDYMDYEAVTAAYGALSPEERTEANLYMLFNGNKSDMEKVRDRMAKYPQIADRYQEDKGFGPINNFCYKIMRDQRDEGQVSVGLTMEKAVKNVKDNGLQEEFGAWQDKVIDGLGYDQKFFDGFTADGTRRYKAATLENISKYMKKQGRNASDDHAATGSGMLSAKMAKKLDSLAQIRAARGQLIPSGEESAPYDAKVNEIHDAIRDLVVTFWNDEISQQSGLYTGELVAMDYVNDFIVFGKDLDSVVEDYNNKEHDNLSLSDEDRARFIQLREDIRKMPTHYFETKFERPVTIDEFRAAVVPDTTSEDMVRTLMESGLQVFTYAKEDDGSRREATLKAAELDGVMFSVVAEEDAAQRHRDEVRRLSIIEEAQEKLPKKEVFHGSANVFERFDHSHMGEGEGNQAFGWGTYLTESMGIAKSYANTAVDSKSRRLPWPMNPDWFFFYKGQPIDRTTVNPLQMAQDLLDQQGTVAKARAKAERFAEMAKSDAGDEMAANWAEAARILSQSRKSDFTRKMNYHEGERVLYKVAIPEDNGENYIEWRHTLAKPLRRRVADEIRRLPDAKLEREKHGPNWLPNGWETLANVIAREQYAGQEIHDRLLDAIGYDEEVSRILHDAGFVGFKYEAQQGDSDKNNYVIFDEGDMDIADTAMFSLTRNNRSTVERWLDKRKDLSTEAKRAVVEYLDGMTNPRLQLATAKWFTQGVIRIPEDMPKVEQAVSVAGKAKVDPLQYDSPMALLEAHADFKPSEKRINPDEVSTLHKAMEYPEQGVVVYSVDETEESRKNMRQIINTHFGVEASPWCLLQGDGNGNLTEQSAYYWKHYNGYLKQVAFKDGKLLAFSANDSHERLWWDREDTPHYDIPYGLMPIQGDALGRSTTFVISKDGKLKQEKDGFLVKGNRQNGEYWEWHPNGNLAMHGSYKNGKMDGTFEDYSPDGVLEQRRNFKDGDANGVFEYYYEDGALRSRSYWKNDKPDGEHITYRHDGTPEYMSTYKDGRLDGLKAVYNSDGSIAESCEYKKGKLDGLHKVYGPDSKLRLVETYKDGEKNGEAIKYDYDGSIHFKENYRNGKRDGIQEYYDYGKGRIALRLYEKDGIIVKSEGFTSDGKLTMLKNYDDAGEMHGVQREWYREGNIRYMHLYEHGEKVRDLLAEGVTEEEAEGLSFSLVTDQNEIDRLNATPTVRAYRAMALIDGKLYPPMSTKEPNAPGERGKKLKMRQPSEIGAWERSDEAPDKAKQGKDGKWYFDLKKGNGGDVNGVLYNPYFHTSASPLNDQFSGAYNYPELVTVEVEVPVSEFRPEGTAYKAEKANDPVGPKDWHSGTVTAQLGEGRQVVLTRWVKPVRIVPDSEVAAMVAPKLKEKNIAVPYNLVTPSLRAELEKQGVNVIGEDGKGNAENNVSLSHDTDIRGSKKETADRIRRPGLYGPSGRTDGGRVGGDDGRYSDIQLWRREYDISESSGEEAGRISFDNLERLFNDLNEDKELSPLFEKVAGIAKDSGRITPYFRENANPDRGGEAKFSGRLYYNIDALTDWRRRQMPRNIVHELIHGVTMSTLAQYEDGEPLSDTQKAAAQEIFDIYKTLTDGVDIDSLNEHVRYALQNEYELVAGISDPVFRDYLRGIKDGKRTLWQRLVDAIKRILGIDKSAGTMDARLDKAVDDLLDNFDVNTFDATANLDADQEFNSPMFSMVNENQEIFVSNAAKAVESIKNDKATPEQWLKMLEKNGGLKAGEDKWIGLSDWLKEQDKKTLTKQEVLDYINQNKIQIEETHYSNDPYRGQEEYIQETIGRGRTAQELQEEINEILGSEEYKGLAGDNIDDELLMDVMSDRYGDDFRLGYDIEDGQIYYMYDPDVASSDLNQYLMPGKARYINATRLTYTTSGLDNKAEIALTVPTIEKYNEMDEIHFGDAGEGRAIAWIRFGDIETSDINLDKDLLHKSEQARIAYDRYYSELLKKYGSDRRMLEFGSKEEQTKLGELGKEYKKASREVERSTEISNRKRILVIDEIQSKRHQDAREKGYRTEEQGKVLTEFAAAVRRLDRYTQDLADYYMLDLRTSPLRMLNELDDMIEHSDKRLVAPGSLEAVKEQRNQLSKLIDERNALKEEREKVAGKIPAAPFEKNWHELAMKRMLRLAAEEGYDYLAWTTGEQQAERYDIGKAVESISATKFGRAYGFSEDTKQIVIDFREGYSSTLRVNREGKIVATGGDDIYLDKNISEVVGKELAVRLLGDDGASIKGEGLRVGGEGMKGFYDDILPRFVNKYGKKWGISVSDMELPIGETGSSVMHSIPITDQMKEDVMEGQLMFSMTGKQVVESVDKNGLESVVPAEDLNDFYRNVYEAIPEGIRKEVVDRAMENGLNFRQAMKDYLAEMAAKKEDTTGLVRMAGEMIRPFIEGGEALSDDDIHYILWRGNSEVSEDMPLTIARNEAMKRRFANEEEPHFSLTSGVQEAGETAKAKVEEAGASLDEQKKALKGDLLTAARAMSAQKHYDQKTVDAIVTMAKDLLKDQEITLMTRREIARVLGIVKASVGRNASVVRNNVEGLVDLVIDHMMKTEAAALDKLRNIKATRTDAAGVNVQGRLDVRGQNIISAFNEGIKSYKYVADDDGTDNSTIGGRMAELSNIMTGKDEARAKEAEAEYFGLALAGEYHKNIKDSIAEETALKNEQKAAENEFKERGISREALNEFKKSIKDSIRENHVERVEAYRELRIKLNSLLAGSVDAASAFRQAERDRINDIHHLANSDLEGRPASEFKKNDEDRLSRLVNGDLFQIIAGPLATFDQMLRLMGNKSVTGEGNLWNKFMRGWVDASEKEYIGQRDAKNELDKKVSEVFGRKMRWSDLYDIEGRMPKMVIDWWDDGEMRPHELTQGNLLYIYMVNKMADGKTKLRKMGISEEKVEAIKDIIDPRFIKLADWLQEEFLVKLRNKYNAVHERMFGASMAAIENYFPLRINKNSRYINEDVNVPADLDAISTKTSAIKKRIRNSKPLDLVSADAFSTVIEHIDEMENWAAFAEFKRDISTLLSYTKFHNRVRNMNTVYGAGDTLWNNFKDICYIASGTYRPKGKESGADRHVTSFIKGVTAAKITFRVYTAFKQLLSAPAFITDANPVHLTENFLMPWKAWKWSMENLPLLEKRWKSRMAGDTRLMDFESEWKAFKTNVYQTASRWGMTPNGFIDALTCSIGARAMYQTRYDRYIKDGYTKEQADKKAKQDATILYNETQQSNENAFVSTMQIDRTFTSSALSVFRNASMAYQRQLHDALRNYERLGTGNREKTLEFMTKLKVREGMDEEAAKKAAERDYNREWWRGALRVATFGFILQYLWALGGSGVLYLLFGKDDKKKNQILLDTVKHAKASALEGLAGGNIMSELIYYLRYDNKGLRNYNPSLLPIVSDMKKLFGMMSYDKVAAASELINLAVQIGIGVNPQTMADTVVAIIDACNGDLDTAKEAMILIMRVLQCPQSQIDEIYIDELGEYASSAKKMTYEEMAKRYVDYKVRRGAPYTEWAYSEGDRAKREKSYKKKFKDKVKERKELDEK